MSLEISQDELVKYLLKFYPSLRQYPGRYLPLVFEQYGEVPKHFAYLCPLCLVNVFYTQDKNWHYTDSFSMDHYPPQNVKGRKKMMVCKTCNNTAGYSYEKYFKETVLREAYSRKVRNTKIPARSVLDNVPGWLPGSVVVDDDGSVNFQISPKHRHRITPLTPEQQKSNNNGKGFTIQIRMDAVDEKKALKAILKTAYLFCFDYWGYDFVFSVAGQLIRDVLNDKANYPIPVPTLWYDNKAEVHQGIKIPTGMVFIDKPNEYRSMFVHIEAEIKEIDYRCIIPVQIPHPDDNDFLDVKRVQQFFTANPLHQIVIKPIDFEFTLAFPNPYSRTWEEIKKLKI